MPSKLGKPTILVVDDDHGLLILVESLLEAEDWEVVILSSGLQAFAWLQENTADLLVLDLKLRDIEGRELIKKLNDVGRGIPFIIVTGQGDELTAVEMMKRGALDYTVKDVNFLELLPTVVRRALTRLTDEKRLAQAEIEANESRLLTQAVLDSLAANIAVIDAEGNILSVNEPWRRFAEENGGACFTKSGVGSNYLEICRRAADQGESGAKEVMEGILTVLNRTKKYYSIEYCCHAPGLDRWFLMTTTQMDWDGHGVVVAHTDITARKKAEEAIREAEEFGKQVIRGAQAGIIVCDRDGKLIVWNPFMEQITGRHAAEVKGREINEVFSELHQPRIEKPLKHALVGEVSEASDLAIDHVTTGKRFWITARFAPWRDANHIIVGVIVAVRDITERRRLEAEVLGASDREQQRIGQDLHDGLGQQLTGLEMKSFLLVEDLGGPDLNASREQLLAQARQISARLKDCVTLTRSLARNLAPVNIKAGGLAGALEQLAHNTRLPDKINCRFSCSTQASIGNTMVESHLFRIAQEAVNNALKHSCAKNIHISLREAKGLLRLQIKDDGHGLPKKVKTGMGLNVMRHRAHVVGASLEIESKQGRGVKILCTLPMTSL